MNTIHVGGRRLGLDGLSTEGAGVVVGVWPDQQQAGQDTQQRIHHYKTTLQGNYAVVLLGQDRRTRVGLSPWAQVAGQVKVEAGMLCVC